MTKHIVIVAGEPSGDLHASNLIRELKVLQPGLEISGLGGRKMQEAGANLLCNIADSAVMGFTEVLKKIKFFQRLKKQLLAHIESQKPECVILVDFPGFNLRLAQDLKKQGVPVIYYISPQVWAWGQKRIHKIKELVDKMIVIFNFEKELYEKYGLAADFIGHPLLEVVKPSMPKNEFAQHLDISPDAVKTIAILPGSRKIEVRRILPVLLEAASLIQKGLNVQFILPKAPNLDRVTFDEIMRQVPGLNLKVTENLIYDCLNIADLALVASGTATLETAILQKPMVIVYKVSYLTWLISRALIQIPYIGLVNVVAGRKIAPEFIQFDAIPEKIAKETLRILNSPAVCSSMQAEISKIKESLGAPGASRRAAESILSFIQQRR